MKNLAYILIIGVCLSGCASYYQRYEKFQSRVTEGKLDEAEKLLESDKRIQKNRNRLLYLLNMGFINHLQQDFALSNEYFNEADLLIEDYNKKLGSEALALISNPEVKPYRAEDFEEVMIHYYKALNYLNLKDFDASLVEARRMNLTLNRLDDKFKDRKNKYQVDAFAHIVMGLSYEASGQLNDAFIAYRNAYEIYAGERGYFGLECPDQLKQDILRLAVQLGFQSEVEYYEKQFGFTYKEVARDHGEAIIFWNNGMGPVKDEWSINFFAIDGEAGYINFTNTDLGLTFPIHVGDDEKKRQDLLALRVIRVAFPKYVERPTYYERAFVMMDGKRFAVEQVEDVNAIAFKSLEDRFIREVSTSLLRLALKKVAEYELQKQNEAIGALATIANAVTEKADTRNWQTLPHSISYSRVPLNKGSNTLKLHMVRTNTKEADVATFEFNGDAGSMHFLPYHSLEHLPMAYWDRAAGNRVEYK